MRVCFIGMVVFLVETIAFSEGGRQSPFLLDEKFDFVRPVLEKSMVAEPVVEEVIEEENVAVEESVLGEADAVRSSFPEQNYRVVGVVQLANGARVLLESPDTGQSYYLETGIEKSGMMIQSVGNGEVSLLVNGVEIRLEYE